MFNSSQSIQNYFIFQQNYSPGIKWNIFFLNILNNFLKISNNFSCDFKQHSSNGRFMKKGINGKRQRKDGKRNKWDELSQKKMNVENSTNDKKKINLNFPRIIEKLVQGQIGEECMKAGHKIGDISPYNILQSQGRFGDISFQCFLLSQGMFEIFHPIVFYSFKIGLEIFNTTVLHCLKGRFGDISSYSILQSQGRVGFV